MLSLIQSFSFLRFAMISPWMAVALLAMLFGDHTAATHGPVIMLGASTTDVIEMFKYTYAKDRLTYYAAQEVVLWRILSKKGEDVGGRGQWILPIQVANVGTFRGHVESGALETGRVQPDTAEALFSLQEFHGIYDVSWKMLQDARKSEFAFERAIEFLDRSFKRRVLRLLNADLLGDGRGSLGMLPAADNQTQISVRALPLVDQGMLVDVMDDTDDNTKLAGARTIQSILVPTREIVISGGAIAGSAAGDYFTAANSVAVATGALHLNGILNVLSASNPKSVVGNYGTINRSTAGNEFWQASELTNGGTLRPFTEDLGLQGLDLCRERGGVMMTDLISNLAIGRRYHEQLRGETMFTLGNVKPFGSDVGLGRAKMTDGEKSEGQSPYVFGALNWDFDMFFDANTICGINRDHFFIGHGDNEVPQPLSEIFEGQIPFFKATANANFEVVSYWQGELLSDWPAAGVKWTDIAES
jgi:hypothetical protein